MEVKEVKFKISVLAKVIENAIREFERDTGVFVDDISVVRERTMDSTSVLIGVQLDTMVTKRL